MTPSSGIMVSAGRPEPSVPATTAASAECVYRACWHTAQLFIHVPTPRSFLINQIFFFFLRGCKHWTLFIFNAGKATTSDFFSVVYWSFQAWGQTITRKGRNGNYLRKMPASHTCQNTDEPIIKDQRWQTNGGVLPQWPFSFHGLPCFQLLLTYINEVPPQPLHPVFTQDTLIPDMSSFLSCWPLKV